MSAKKSWFFGLISGIVLCIICAGAWQMWEARQLEKRVAFFEQWGKLKFETPTNE